LFENFTYKATKGDRIGIIGANGSGKSTLLNMMTGEIPPDTGTIKVGSTARIGYFRQESSDIDPTINVLAAVRDVAEYIDTGVGRDRYLSAKDMLLRFNFPTNQFGSLVGNLSGGERRRLGLLRVLMNNPNVLLLDEPTNDFDIQTLGALEEYLQHFFGVLIIVSHDRAFLDRTVEFIYSFEEDSAGKRVIKQYPGNYSSYLEKKETAKEDAQNEALRKEQADREAAQNLAQAANDGKPKKTKYQAHRERESLERKIENLEKKKADIEEFLATSGTTDYAILKEKSDELVALMAQIDTVTEAWLELQE
jgi:ATP-binding cassette subfamily F protein uup